jgi:hypothetical protein
MGWSVALACASVGEPGQVFRPDLRSDVRAAGEFARRLYPAATLVESGDTVLDFALWPYEDEVFVGHYDDQALIVCDRRLFCLDDDARRVADTVAGVLPGACCGVLVLHSVVSACWFRKYESGRLVRDLFVTADDGIVVDQGERLPAEKPYWTAIDAGVGDVPLPFDQEDLGLDLAEAYLFGQGIAQRGATGFLPLELPLRRFKLS